MKDRFIMANNLKREFELFQTEYVEKVISKRVNWIDCAKAIAIFAVIIDHCNGTLYTNPQIAQASYYSVSLFILLAGISAGLSFKEMDYSKEINKSLKKIKNLFIHYAIATFIVTCFSNKFFDLNTYLSNLINFSAAGPYYYFVFFFQLIVISSFLVRWCRWCEKKGNIWHILTLVILGGGAAVTINYTYIITVHGGGKFLGGGYLLPVVLYGNYAT